MKELKRKIVVEEVYGYEARDGTFFKTKNECEEYEDWKKRALKMESYADRALVFAEQFGIVEYYLKENTMFFYPTYPMEHITVKATVNLDTMHETRKSLKRYYKAYAGKIAGRYQAIWDY